MRRERGATTRIKSMLQTSPFSGCAFIKTLTQVPESAPSKELRAITLKAGNFWMFGVVLCLSEARYRLKK
jgi:hypothetical protein